MTSFSFKQLLASASLALLALGGRSESEVQYCRESNQFLAAPEGAGGRKYAPSREIDILHLAIDVTPDFKARSIAAETTLRFKPIAKPLSELTLDAVDLNVSSVGSSEKIGGWHASDHDITVVFDPPIPVDKEASVNIRYEAFPKKGLYFRTPEMGYHENDTHIWTQGEAIEARHWYPCFDSPNEKFTSEITCRVPEGMVVLSNGKMMSEEKDSGSGLVRVRWAQEKPHATYLMALVAGNLKKVEDKYKDIPLAFYTPASQIEHAQNSFKDTKDMMGFFEEEIGVPYPWAKYFQVCVDDFGFGGMENTTLTILNERTLHPKEAEPVVTSQGLIAHELAHQWFGDLVTCKDWANVWLNEGFATYYERLYDGHKNGRDDMIYGMYQAAKGIFAQPNQTNAIVRRDYRDPNEQFSFLAYPKGGWVLHMLRSQLGADLYRKCIKTYIERHQFGNVETEDLNRVIEELSGRSFDRFFDQWVYHGGFPDIGVNYSWDEKNKLAKVSLSQNQKISEDILLFEFPLTVRFQTKGGSVVDRQITVKEKSEDFYFPLAEAPETLRLDPELTLLARFNFTPATPMLQGQLKNTTDMIGRLIAVEQLGARKDKDSINRLKETLRNDPFHGVRSAASRALRSIHSDESFQALLDSQEQSDARVRNQVLRDINGFYGSKSLQASLKAIDKETNPEIKADALGSIGAYSAPEVKDTLLRFVSYNSDRNRLADEAIQSMRAQDDAVYLEPLLKTLRDNEKQFTSGGFGRGLETLAFLARTEDKKDPYREFILPYVNSKKQRVQLAALAALGILGDPKAIGVLEKFTGEAKESPLRTAAEKSITSLRDSKKPSAELGSLRGEVLTLQRENRELRKDLDDLKKKLEALSNSKPLESKPSKRSPSKSQKPD